MTTQNTPDPDEVRVFTVETTWRAVQVVEIEDPSLEGDALRDAIINQTDSSTASLEDWDYSEVNR